MSRFQAWKQSDIPSEWVHFPAITFSFKAEGYIQSTLTRLENNEIGWKYSEKSLCPHTFKSGNSSPGDVISVHPDFLKTYLDLGNQSHFLKQQVVEASAACCKAFTAAFHDV